MNFKNNIYKRFLGYFLFIVSFFVLIIIWLGNYLTLLTSAETSYSYTQLPIIMYHGLIEDKSMQNRFFIPPQDFENDLKYITENGYTTIFMQDLIDYVDSEKSLPKKSIMITFDDGYYNNYLYAFTLAKKYNTKMVVSPIGKCIDRYSEINNKNPKYAHCTWENLREMQDSGLVEVENHSYDMHKKAGLRNGSKRIKGESIHQYKKYLTEDLELMQKRVSEQLEITPTTFVYPFGAVSESSIDIIKEMGFRATLGCENKVNKITHDPECLYNLKRFIRTHNVTVEKILKSHVENTD